MLLVIDLFDEDVFYDYCIEDNNNMIVLMMMMIITIVAMLFQALAPEATVAACHLCPRGSSVVSAQVVLLVIFLMMMFYMFAAMKITTKLIVLMFMMMITMTAMLFQALAPEARHLCTWEHRRQCTSCSVGRCIKRL